MWTAIFLATLIAAGVGAYGAWAAHAVAQGAAIWPFVLGLPLAYLAVPFLITGLWVTMGWRMRAPRPTDKVLGWRARVRLFVNEFLALAQSAPKMILYRWLVRDPAPAPASLPVLLVHGVGCNAGVWYGLKGYLEAQRLGPVYAISYGPPLAPIEHFADQMAQKIATMRDATGATQVVLVGHSMGGLVNLAYLRRYGGAAVREMIAIGTPFHGSRHAYMMFGAAMQDLRPGSRFLAPIDDPGAFASGVPVVSIWSWHDSMVTPQTSSRLDWAENIAIAGVAHNALLGDRDVWARVAAEIRKARDRVPAPQPVAEASASLGSSRC
ncbi:MAG: alpha/beta fold hydrolase [Betaproteobacteria bacterium]